MFNNGREKDGIETLKDPKLLIDYSQTVDDVYEFGRLESNKEKESVNSVWWCDIRFEIL